MVLFKTVSAHFQIKENMNLVFFNFDIFEKTIYALDRFL